MKDNLKNCSRCGRLFAGMPRQRECPDCLRYDLDVADAVDQAVDVYGCKTVSEIAERTGMSSDDVLQIVRHTPGLRDLVESEAVCERCQERPATSVSPYCLNCRMELNRAFSKAAADLLRRLRFREDIRTQQPVGYQHMSVLQELRVKRTRTGSYRFDPTPRRAK